MKYRLIRDYVGKHVPTGKLLRGTEIWACEYYDDTLQQLDKPTKEVAYVRASVNEKTDRLFAIPFNLLEEINN